MPPIFSFGEVFMRTRLYVIRDVLAESCGPVFQAPNDDVARRNFVNLLRKVESYDRDSFRLFLVGEFTDGPDFYVGSLPASEVSVTLPKFEDVGQRALDFEGVNNG